MKRYGFIVMVMLTVFSLGAAESGRLVPPDVLMRFDPDRGVLFSDNGGTTWEPRNTGLPVKVVFPFTEREPEDLTGLQGDPLDGAVWAATTSDSVFQTRDQGASWQKIPLDREVISSASYITGVCPIPGRPESLLLATSFSGLYRTDDAGASWREIGEKSLIYRGAGFYEAISGIAVSPDDPECYYLLYEFGNGLFKTPDGGTSWEPVALPVPADTVSSLEFIRDKEGRFLLRLTAGSRDWVREEFEEKWRARDRNTLSSHFAPPRLSVEEKQRIERAADRTGFYLSPYNARGDRLNRYLDILEANGLNSFVVDVKDDRGVITYDSELPQARRIGAVKALFSLETLLETAHERGFYVIGRIVVFKDEKLFRAEERRLAAWDKVSNTSWGNFFRETDEESGETRLVQREFWVDPFARDVWRYNRDIAEELQEKGIDEIQFDYIRFPSDGDLSRIEYRHRRPGMTRINALESFFRVVRERIDIPISTDLFGFNAYYRMGNWIGQNIDMVADYVDVISPMYYPSHFPSSFMSDTAYLERAYEIYREGTRRAASIVGERAVIRPYVQAFLLRPEFWMEKEDYQEYLMRQLEGAYRAETSGFTLWNMANNFYMLRQPLMPLLEERLQRE